MRKLKLQMQLTLDGFVAGPNGEMDWMVWDWDEELNQYVSQLTDSVELILLGRKLAEGFIPTWQDRLANPETSDESARFFVDTPKLVFSKTLKPEDPSSKGWKNTQIVTRNFVEEISDLKQQQGKDLIVYGGSRFVISLIEKNLIDEYNLFINPVALGKGMPIFSQLKKYLKMKPLTTKAFSCGISLLSYTPDTKQDNS